MVSLSPSLSWLPGATPAGIAIWIAVALTAASVAYILFAAARVAAFAGRPAERSAEKPPVTVMKPVCGLDHQLYENLLSFCRQDYPAYQVVFGVRDADDPAIPVIRRVIADAPETDTALVIDGRVTGSNLKVSNLCNMEREAKHPFLVIADSDMRVGPDYLASVAAPFADPRVGAVTCLYKGVPAEGTLSRLAAMFINEGFLPSVLVALSFQRLRFCFGATMAARREALEEIGGFAGLRQYLADDYMLGRRLSDQGWQVELSPYLVWNVTREETLGSMLRHELRWARTIRTVEPAGYAASFIVHVIPVSVLAAGVAGPAGGLWGLAALLVAMGLASRLLLHYVVQAKLRPCARPAPWLVPVRDVLGFLVWGASFFGRGISWRGRDFAVHVDGRMTSR
jgi:ceramide glucosyltransferase